MLSNQNTVTVEYLHIYIVLLAKSSTTFPALHRVDQCYGNFASISVFSHNNFNLNVSISTEITNLNTNLKFFFNGKNSFNRFKLSSCAELYFKHTATSIASAPLSFFYFEDIFILFYISCTSMSRALQLTCAKHTIDVIFGSLVFTQDKQTSI